MSLRLKIDELVCLDGQHALEGQLLSLPGIKSVAANFQNQQVLISYYGNQQQESAVRNQLLGFGFTVDGQAGDPAARRRLPTCCLRQKH